MDIEQIEQLIAQQAIDLLLYKDEDEIQGMLTLVTFTIRPAFVLDRGRGS